jgi:hypothetical protein
LALCSSSAFPPPTLDGPPGWSANSRHAPTQRHWPELDVAKAAYRIAPLATATTKPAEKRYIDLIVPK